MVRRSSSDSASSRVRASTLSNRRTFSIAIAAWSANVDDQLDLLIGEWPHLRARQDEHADRDSLAQHWDAENGAVIRRISAPRPSVYSGSAFTSGMWTDPPFEQRAPGAEPAFGSIGSSWTYSMNSRE